MEPRTPSLLSLLTPWLRASHSPVRQVLGDLSYALPVATVIFQKHEFPAPRGDKPALLGISLPSPVLLLLRCPAPATMHGCTKLVAVPGGVRTWPPGHMVL